VSGANATAIERVGLSIETGNGSASFEQPDTIIYVGNISIAGASPSVAPLLFNASSTVGAATPKYPANELWMNTDDSYVAGSSVVWDPACGTPVPDAGASDASIDAGVDASIDAGADATIDAAADAGSSDDATIDTGSDGGAEATTDATSADGQDDASDDAATD
jgi:hypothetical protein